MTERRLVSTSEMRTFLRCPKEHHYRYGLGYRPHAKANALAFGTAMHSALEAWFTTAGQLWAGGVETFTDEPLDAALGALRSIVDLDPFDRARLVELVHGYHYRWGGDRFDVIGVELEFRAPLCNPLTGEPSPDIDLGGKMDGLVSDSHGRVWVVEHKTSSANIGFGENYWQRLRLDLQCSVYLLGARALGYEPAGVLYDVIGKPRIRPYKHESTDAFAVRFRDELAKDPTAFYARADVVRLEGDEREARRDIWHVAHLIAACADGQIHPRNTDACERYGRLCEYFDPCTHAADITDPILFRQVTKAHEELSK